MRLSHVSIRSTLLEESRRFYECYFGARVIHIFNGSTGNIYGYFLELMGGGIIEILHYESHNESGQGNIDHFCIEIESIQTFLNRLPEKYVVTTTHRGRTDKVLQAMIRDPDGIKIELHQFDEFAVFKPRGCR
jgi:glyoxylase I family protein